MQEEKQRIRKLAGFQILHTARRLPIVKITPEQWTSPETTQRILKQFPNKRTLVLCHGHTYPRRPKLPDSSTVFYVDINPVARPDFVGDIRNTIFMANFPENYFNLVILTYLPPPNPFSSRNRNIYWGVNRLLRPGGRLQSHYLYQMLARRPHATMESVQQIIQTEGKKYFREATTSGVMAVFSK